MRWGVRSPVWRHARPYTQPVTHTIPDRRGEIVSTRCSITARGPLERFQEELLAAADRWLFGDNSDVVIDATDKTAIQITGRLRVGECPRCGAHLRLEIDGTGNHLRIEGEEDDA